MTHRGDPDSVRRDGSVATRRALGTVLIVVAVVGVLVSATGTILAWQLLGRLTDSSGDSLEVTIEALDALDDSIILADEVLGATAQSLTTAGATLRAVSTAFEEADGVVDEIDELTEIVGPTLGEAASALRRLQGVGDSIDSLLEDVDDLPLTPDYDSSTGLGDSIGDIADEIEPLPEAFEGTSRELDDFAGAIDDLGSEVDRLVADIDDVTVELAATDVLVDRYRATIRDARRVASNSLDGLDDDLTWMRVVLVIGGVNFAMAQIVPFWLGRRMRRTGPEGHIVSG